MFQFLKYLLHKQIIEMCHFQNLRRPLSVPCPTQCNSNQFTLIGELLTGAIGALVTIAIAGYGALLLLLEVFHGIFS